MGPVPLTPAPPPQGGYEGFEGAVESPGPSPQEESYRVVSDAGDDDVTNLSEEDRRAFDTLLTCGRRTKTIEVMGHKVTIESLNVDDDLRIGVYCKEYRDSDAFPRAIQVATCAAGIRAINNRPMYSALSSDESSESIFQIKVDKLAKYYPIVITEIYREILNLDAEFAELAMKLGKLKG
jgi:hypothetical protein